MAVPSPDLENAVLLTARVTPYQQGVAVQFDSKRIAQKTNRTIKTINGVLDSICSRYPTVRFNEENRISFIPLKRWIDERGQTIP